MMVVLMMMRRRMIIATMIIVMMLRSSLNNKGKSDKIAKTVFPDQDIHIGCHIMINRFVSVI